MNDLTKPNEGKLTAMEMAAQMVKLETLKKDVEARLRVIKQELLTTMQDLDVLTLKTGSYTLTRRMWKKAMVNDDEAAIKALEAMGVPTETKVVLDMGLMKIPVDNLLNEGKEIDGIELRETPYVSVRLAKDTKKVVK
jgi:hypothetical protein